MIVKCDHCSSDFESDRLAAKSATIIWCADCVYDHWHLFARFDVENYPSRPMRNPEFWELLCNVTPLRNIPHRDNIVD